jgi:hypothetical protein
MKAYYKHKTLSPEQYLDWLSTYLSLLNDFTSYVEKNRDSSSSEKMVSFLRTAEHIFNFFINHKRTYEFIAHPEANGVSPAKSADSTAYYGLKIERDKLANKIAEIIESDPKIKKRFKEFCDNLKEPRILGCQL